MMDWNDKNRICKDDILSEYISSDHKVPYHLIPNGTIHPLGGPQYDILFIYEGKEYQIPAPFLFENDPDMPLMAVYGSSHNVDDKIDEILFERLCSRVKDDMK